MELKEVSKMWWWPFIIIACVWIAAMVFHIRCYREKNNSSKISIVFVLISALVWLLALGLSQSKDAGSYVYEVNGATVSAGTFEFGQNIGLSIFGGFLTNFSAMGVAYLVTHGIKVGIWLQRISVCLILFAVMLALTTFFIQKELKAPDAAAVSRILLIVAAVSGALGILGLVVYSLNKK